MTTARQAGLVACVTCGRVDRRGAEECARCGDTLPHQSRRSLQTVWAWLFAGIVVYIPANTYPMLRTSTLLDKSESTIIGGAIDGLIAEWSRDPTFDVPAAAEELADLVSALTRGAVFAR